MAGTSKRSYKPKQENIKKLEQYVLKLNDARILQHNDKDKNETRK